MNRLTNHKLTIPIYVFNNLLLLTMIINIVFLLSLIDVHLRDYANDLFIAGALNVLIL